MKYRRNLLLIGILCIAGFVIIGCRTETVKEAEMEKVMEDSVSVMETVNQACKPANMTEDYRNFYEIFVYSFYDSNDDGIGDLKGIEQQLDYLNDGSPETTEDLGITGIWLTPIMPATTYHKYDVTDYYDIDKEYGTLEDFKSLVAECDRRRIDVIIDLVMNHTSSQHPWFAEAYEYYQSIGTEGEPDVEVCPYADYYHFTKEPKERYYPVEGTDWYYEAQFGSGMPDLNLQNEAVSDEFEKIVSFWLESGVSGFRLDAVQEYETGKTDENIQILSRFITMVKEKAPKTYVVGEVWNDMPTYVQYYESGIDSCFDFAFAGPTGIIANTIKNANSKNASSFGKAQVNIQSKIKEYGKQGVDAPFYTNHDMGRSAGYYSGKNSEKQTKIALAMNQFMSGNSFLYYGEELGMKGSGKDENKRAPMYWGTDAGGTCNGPAAMDQIKMKYGSLAEQKEDGNSIYHFVKETIKLRNAFPEIAAGDVFFEETYSDADICIVRKILNEQELLIIYNISANDKVLDLSGMMLNDKPLQESRLAGMLLTDSIPVSLENTKLTIPAYSIALLQ